MCVYRNGLFFFFFFLIKSKLGTNQKKLGFVCHVRTCSEVGVINNVYG